MSRFKEALRAREDFVITCELIPGRGFSGKGIDHVLAFAEAVKARREIHALSLTDNAGGNPALSADALAQEVAAMGVDVIVHFSLKDMNRNAMEARAYALGRNGVTNLLVITGDYPVSGFLGIPRPVFDIDSVIALHYLKKMNQGLEVAAGRKTARLEETDFFLGAVASPFKWSEGSAVMQYYKLQKKVRAGADYLISQLGYDARKYRELIRYVRGHLNLDIPLLGSVYVLSLGAAKFMKRGEVPGCYVNKRFLKILAQEAKAEDKGKRARLERAARQVAVLKGLGYDGAHLEGLNLKVADVDFIMGRAKEAAANWPDYLEEFSVAPRKGFYLFEGGRRIKPPMDGDVPRFTKTPRRHILSPSFWLSRIFHKLVFVEGTPGYLLMRALSRRAEKSKSFFKMFNLLEKSGKKVLYDCRHCADCALFEVYYQCPESKCPKRMRIGPCGGSRPGGRCEVFEDRRCIWEQAYWRAKRLGELEKLRYIIPPRDWACYNTSSWINYFLKQDHVGKKLDISDRVGR